MRLRLVVAAGGILLLVFMALVAAEENPANSYQQVNSQVMPGMPPRGEHNPVGTLKGYIQTVEGQPLSGGKVYFFDTATGPVPAPEKYWRVPDADVLLDDKGGFSVDLPPGRYYVSAILRKDRSLMGSLSVGDLYYSGGNGYEVLSGEENNINVLSGAKPFSANINAEGEGVTAIEGSVIDLDGKRIENALVFAHKKPDVTDRPVFVSNRTGKNGVYRLRVADSGAYYLRVRNSYGGGMPASGTIMGVYGGDNPKAVVVKKGEVLQGIDLTGVEFVKPTRKPNNNSHN